MAGDWECCGGERWGGGRCGEECLLLLFLELELCGGLGIIESEILCEEGSEVIEVGILGFSRRLGEGSGGVDGVGDEGGC